jgi:hypothetical protein
MVVYLLVGAEVLVEGLMDVSLIPPAWRFVHLLWIALMADAAVVFGLWLPPDDRRGRVVRAKGFPWPFRRVASGPRRRSRRLRRRP